MVNTAPTTRPPLETKVSKVPADTLPPSTKQVTVAPVVVVVQAVPVAA